MKNLWYALLLLAYCSTKSCSCHSTSNWSTSTISSRYSTTATISTNSFFNWIAIWSSITKMLYVLDRKKLSFDIFFFLEYMCDFYLINMIIKGKNYLFCLLIFSRMCGCFDEWEKNINKYRRLYEKRIIKETENDHDKSRVLFFFSYFISLTYDQFIHHCMFNWQSMWVIWYLIQCLEYSDRIWDIPNQ